MRPYLCAAQPSNFCLSPKEIAALLDQAVCKHLSLQPVQGRVVLHADITAPGYRHSSNGQIKLDSKESIKKELGKSPAHACEGAI